MKVIFLGPPGVGKGTVATRVKDKLGIIQISTGDILREEVKKESDLGKKAKEYMDEGQLVPDEIVIKIIKRRVQKEDAREGFILDGFPRTIPQAEALEGEIEIDKVINFEAPEEVIIKRLSGRRVCSECGAIYHIKNIPPKKEGVCDKCGGELIQRDDDKPEAIKERLEVYKEQTEPLIDFYKKRNLLVTVDADQELNKIIEDTLKVLKSIE